VSLIVMAGCEVPVASSLPQATVAASPLDASDSGRHRSDFAGNRWTLNRDGVYLYQTNNGKLLEVSIPDWQWVDEPDACLPDLAIGPDGEAVITSNVVPVLWRVDVRTLVVTKHELVLDADNDKDVGFSKLVYSAEHRAYFAISDVHRSLWRIDRSLREARKLGQLEPVRDPCDSSNLSRSSE
jgi:hypothetical protein